jgi:hypothetical protein
MQNSDHYSDEDFQQFLDNHFAGNREEFETHLRECSQCNRQFIAYRSVFSYLQTEFEPAVLEISVAKETADRVFGGVRTKTMLEKAMYWLIFGLTVVIVIICLRYLTDSSFSMVLVAGMVAIVGLHALLSNEEIKLMRQQFSHSMMS